MQKLSNIVIQQRDIELLLLLFHSRILTRRHAAAIVPGTSLEAAKKRIQKLKAAGLIQERTRKTFDQGVLSLSAEGFEWLKASGALPSDSGTSASFSKRLEMKDSILPHELAVVDIKAAFLKAATELDSISIQEFSTMPRLFEFKVWRDDGSGRGTRSVRPDGFIRLHHRDSEGVAWEHLLYAEIDRSTERREILLDRMRDYYSFYREGGMATRFGASRSDYKKFPFQVLIVCKTRQRMMCLVAAFLKLDPRVAALILLSTHELVSSDPFGPVWLSPPSLDPTQGLSDDLPFRPLC